MAKVIFRVGGSDTVVDASPGVNLLRLAQQAGVAVDAPCSGGGTCGKCRVRLLSGALASPPTRHLSDAEIADGWRLACASAVEGDATVEVPDAASAYRGGMRTADLSAPEALADFHRRQAALEAAGFGPDRGVFAATVSLDPPSADDTLPDNERLARRLAEATGAARVTLGYTALRALARVLRSHGFRARCVIEMRDDAAAVLDVLPPEDAVPVAGLAVDLGTTSVAALLVDLETGAPLAQGSAGNGQIRFGADVISRIIESTRPGGGERLRRAALDETLRPLIDGLCARAGVPRKRVYRVCLAGNTVMNHLLLGLYSDPVRMEPYIPSFFHCDDLPATALELDLHPDAKLILAPNTGSYVGGDITAGVFASLLWRQPELSLFVDLGTNGELVLGNDEFLMCCACSAGPAFEGGDISCGMRAVAGAIDSVTVDPDTLEPRYTVIGPADRPAGLCGSGIIDLIAGLFRTGIINGRGRFDRECRRVRRDDSGMARYVVAFREETGGAAEIAVTEADIDSFIRAKGAVFSGIMTMLELLGMEPGMLERVWVAGGIGSGINMKNAVAVGMLPDIPLDRFAYIGNTALTGAWAMLASRAARDKADELARGMTYLELSTQPGYMDAFIGACFLPHTDARLFPGAAR